MQSVRGALAGLLVGVPTAVVVVAVALLAFANPLWIGFDQGRTGAAALTGFDPADLRRATDAIVSDLVLGPPDFDVEVAGAPVLDAAERGHMRDVRTVFTAFYLVAGACGLVLVGAFAATRGRGRAALWRRLSDAGITIAVVTVVGGLMALLLFDQAFMLFHEVFFPQGNYLFDPGTERLVQLFPERFFVESSASVGIVVVLLSVAIGWVGRRRAGMIEARAAAPSPLSTAPVH